MTLYEVFTQLLYGELANTNLAANGPDNLTDADQLKLANHVNLGLTALYKRFALKEQRMNFALQPTVDTYVLSLPDLIKIERVITDSDTDLHLNKEDDDYSCFTPTLNTLRVPLDIVDQASDLPEVLVTDTLTVVYRANHPKIDLSQGYVDAEDVELELPDSHLQALLLFVAARTNTPTGVGQFEGVAGNSYFAKYEHECKRLETEGLEEKQAAGNTKLRDRGFA